MATKKIKKTTVKKHAAKPMPEHKCACGESCNCHCHGRAHWVKHIIVWAIIFALGMACGKMFCCGGHDMKKTQKIRPVFVNGCLNMDSIKNQKMQEALANADANGDGCISVVEYKAFKKSMRDYRKKHQEKTEQIEMDK